MQKLSITAYGSRASGKTLILRALQRTLKKHGIESNFNASSQLRGLADHTLFINMSNADRHALGAALDKGTL